jgi:hypothetical protein
MTDYGAHAPCVICAGPVEPVCGELVHYHAARTTCSSICRNELRSQTQMKRAAGRLVAAVSAWTPGASVTRLAQHHGIKGEALRAALLERGCDLTRARRDRPWRLPGSRTRHREGEPPRDFLLEALLEAYGPRTSPRPRQAPLPARAA